MIKAIVNGIITLITSLVSLILSPIDSLITQYLPGLSNAFSLISNFFTMLGNIIPWVLSYLGITTTTITICIDLIVFMYTAPYLIHSIKLAIKWYNSLKL